MIVTDSLPRIAFVSAPGGSAFMAELLAVVADAVTRAGGHAVSHEGVVADLADERTVFVVVPHEYFAVTGRHPADLLARTIGFCVEHPGTATFEAAARHLVGLGGSVAIGADAMHELGRRGIATSRFVLGCSPMWDRRGAARDIDVAYLGTADEARLRTLARVLPDLAWSRTEVLLPPHEPMTRARPDFLIGEAKWELLARTRVLLNLHREASSAFEWVRALEGITNGCVVLSAPSTGLAPLVPGEHVLIGDPHRMGLVAAAALREPEYLDGIAAAALEVCRTELDMSTSAAHLIDLAGEVVKAAVPSPDRQNRRRSVTAERPLALWMPCERPLPDPTSAGDRQTAALLRDVARLSDAQPPASVRRHADSTNAKVDVICAARPGDGPLGRTLASLAGSRGCAVHVTNGPVSDHGGATVTTSIDYRDPVGRGRARDELLAQGDAPYVLVLDPGDELLGPALAEMVATLDGDASVQVVYPMAALGSDIVVNAMIAESHRLARFAYLGRGYLVRRTWLERLGGFAEDAELDAYVDHDFWQRTAAIGGVTVLLRHVGMRLWRQRSGMTLGHADPAGTHALLSQRARLAPAT